MKYKISYYWEDISQKYPEKIIEASSKEEAAYKYHKSNGIDVGTYEEFLEEEEYVALHYMVKHWGLIIKLIR